MAFKSPKHGLSRGTGYMYEGREIVLAKEDGRPIKTARNSAKWWPDKKKIECATLFAVLQDSQKVGDLSGVPPNTIEGWRNEPWWGEILLKVRKEKNEKLDAAITDVLAQGLDIVKDRFENGEIYIDRKTGAATRVPVNTKNVALVVDIFFDKRQLVRGEATTRTETITQEQKLEKLRENFERLARSKLINPSSEVIDAVIPELREELQTGSGDGIPGTETPEDVAEQSPQNSDEGRSSPQGGRESSGPQASSVEGRLEQPVQPQGEVGKSK